MNVGKNIKKIRELNNISQEKLAKLSGIPRTSLGRYEREERVPTIDTLNKIAYVLDIDIDVLIRWLDILDENPNVSSLLSKVLGLKNYYKIDLQNFDKYIDKYSKLLNLDPKSREFLTFINGSSNNKNLYLKIADILELTENQVYNWILYDVLHSTINQEIFNDSDIINVIPRLHKQDIDDLLSNGLSAENKDLAQIFLKTKYDTIEFERKKTINHLEKVKSKDFEFDALKTLLRSINKGYIINTLNDDQFNCLLTKVQELLEFELFKIEKENTDSKNEN